MDIISDPSSLEFPHFVAAATRWHAERIEGGLPMKAWPTQDDPLRDYRMDVSLCLDPLKIVYTEVSATLEQLYGESLTNRDLDELYNAWFRLMIYKSYQAMIDAKLPVYERRSVVALSGKLGYQKLLLPFGDGTITSSIAYVLPMNPAIKDREAWEALVHETPWLSDDATSLLTIARPKPEAR